MRLGMVGDLHGNTAWATYVINQMGRNKISHVFVLGDAGLWPGLAGIQYLDALNVAAQENNLSVFFVPGNHEWYDGLEAFQSVMPTHKGFSYLRERVLMCGKVNSFKLANKTFIVAGGAVSIDKDWRLAKERGGTSINDWGFHEEHGRGTGARTLWWPQEQLTEEEVNQLTSLGRADILLSHDCSTFTPFGRRLKPDLDSQIHRQKIDRVIESVKPQVHFHGHMHEKYEWNNTLGTDMFGSTPEVSVDTFGLECDGMPDSWGIFDTDEMKFYWPDGVEKLRQRRAAAKEALI